LVDGPPAVVFDAPVFVSEKVDGTNARIIVDADGDWIIGSRENLLGARGDRICDPSMGIVAALRDFADQAEESESPSDELLVLYVEVYGHKIGGAAKGYTNSGRVGFRIFDAAIFHRTPMSVLRAMEPAALSAWRESGEMPFMEDGALAVLAKQIGVERTPVLAGGVPASTLPVSHAECIAYLADLGATQCHLDERPGVGMLAAMEGVVVRTADRRQIAKLRVEDYTRALRAGRRA
jgi:hypothetical protein